MFGGIISVNWEVVILDVLILVNLAIISFWFAGNPHRRSLMALAICFGLMAAGFVVTAAGDVLIAAGLSAKDHWILSRQFRPLPLRYSMLVGFTGIALLLRFGDFNGKRTQ